ncbi:hypothetical protein INT47_000480 [Mucor saturninus]|uniref:N-acetyltransferase domain-containing protein n=1 Tax=Mucor saturninus TaxID=64648 RepID=A0A8H7R062_9FUNG|nr:hypothetical protein INT47_000480 [Mucor saturninus]
MSSRKLEVIKNQEKRLSRRLTVDTQEPYVSIRPIIKKADKEAAYTLSEAYADNILLNWITGAIKDKEKKFDMYQDIFKALIRTAASESREFAIQLNGCKGVLLWSEGHSDILSVGNVMSKKRLWGSLGGLATMRATLIHHRHLSKMKKRIMAKRDHLSVNFIGVLPAERKHGVGSHLLKYVLRKADQVQLPVFAEVWGNTCLGWFQKFGFEVQAEKNLSDKEKVCIYYVVREPEFNPETPSTTPTDLMAALKLEPPREDSFASIQD